MKKLLFAGTLAVMTLLPQLMNGQDAEAPNPDALEAKETKGAPAAGKTPAAATEADKNAAKDKTFADQQKKINDLMEKLKKATKNSEKRKIKDQLLKEQRAYQREVAHAREPLEDQIKKLKAQIQFPDVDKQKLERELAEREQKLQAINKEADLEKWCVKPDTLIKSSPNPGPGKKAAKAQKSQKNRKSKKIKTKKGK